MYALGSRKAQSRLVGRTLLSAFGGNISVPLIFLISLGADAFHLGLFQGLVSVAILTQITSLILVCYLPKARVTVLSDTLVGVLTAAVAIVPWLTAGTDAGLWVAIALLFARDLGMSLNRAAWMPLLQDNVSEEETGRFFSRMRTQIFIVAFVGTVFAGWYIGESRDPAVFVPLILAAGVSFTLRFFLMRRVPETWEPKPANPRAMLERFGLALSDRSFRATFLMTGLFYAVNLFVDPAIFNSYLEKLGYDLGDLVYLKAAQSLGAVASLWFWAKPLDRYGPRALMVPSVVALASLMGIKAFVPPFVDGGDNVVGMAMIYAIKFFDGVFFWSCLRLVLTKIHFRVIRKEWQTESFSLISYASGIMGMVLPPAAGLAVRHINTLGISLPGITYAGHGLMLLATGVLLLAGLLLRSRLPGYDSETSSAEVMANMLRRNEG